MTCFHIAYHDRDMLPRWRLLLQHTRSSFARPLSWLRPHALAAIRPLWNVPRDPQKASINESW